MNVGHNQTLWVKIRHWSWVSWNVLVFILESIADGIVEAWQVMRHEAGLFLGTTFFIIGFLGFKSGRYCDGNTAEYLSCTRPATFYYYDAVHVFLILFGVCCILVWLLKQRHR